MNGKQSKKLREMAAMFYQAQPIKIKTIETIYEELKTIHNGKTVKKSEPRTDTKIK